MSGVRIFYSCSSSNLLFVLCAVSYAAVNDLLRKLLLKFWGGIRDAWEPTITKQESKVICKRLVEDLCIGSDDDSLREVMQSKVDTLYEYRGVSFSSASGRHVYINGKSLPHWDTVDMDSTGDATAYYDLSMQNMKWTIQTSSANQLMQDDGPPSSIWAIELCDDMGWEGSGSLKIQTKYVYT